MKMKPTRLYILFFLLPSILFSQKSTNQNITYSHGQNSTEEIVTNLTPGNYQLAQLSVGDEYYSDRTYTITSIPTDFTGLTWIKTANDDKNSTADALVSFTLTKPAYVYIGFDDRIDPQPNWLTNNFTKTATTIGLSDSKVPTVPLWVGEYDAGNVSLGGNLATGAMEPGPSVTQYIILIRENTDIPTIITENLPDGQVSSPYETHLSGQGGERPYTWSVISGSLPNGLSLNDSTISGTPTADGDFNFTIKLTDNKSDTVSKPFTITIDPVPVPEVVTTSLPTGIIGEAYSAALSAQNGTPPYSWSVISGSLPDGLSLSDSTISGIPTTTEVANFTVQVSDDNSQTATKALSITVNPVSVPVITTATLPNGTVGVAYNAALHRTGGVAPFDWTISAGALPNGLAINDSTISGTPTVEGDFNFTVKVTDKNTNYDTTAFSVTIEAVPVLTVITTELPDGTVNSPYIGILEAKNGETPYQWQITDGTLPDGLALTDDKIMGIPTDDGTWNFTVQVKDNQNDTDTQALSLEIKNYRRRPPIPPKWVYQPWVWEDNTNTQSATTALVQGYIDRDIPVGCVIVDSPWENAYNTFVFNSTAYPSPQQMINSMHSKGVKVLLWITSLINKTSKDTPITGEAPNYDYPKQQGYFINNGAVYTWWKGTGSFIDFTNPDAVTWWQSEMDKVLNMGIDGWKTDSGNRLFPSSAPCYTGTITKKEYGTLYYKNFYEYTLQKRGPQAILFSKPYDENPGDSTYVPIEYTPTGFVGDQLHDWSNKGIVNGISNMFLSSQKGIVAIGSDIGGFMGSMAITKNLLIRWAQLGAMCPIMENGGVGEHRPWTFDSETVTIYRYFAKLHAQLAPYLYTYGVVSHNTGTPILRPESGTWQYTLGDQIFVSTIYQDVTSRRVTFPTGNDWIDFWDDNITFAGGSTKSTYYANLAKYPIFIKKGAIIPMEVKDNTTGHGTAASAGYYTMLVYPSGTSQFTMHPEGKAAIQFQCRQEPQHTYIDISNSNEKYIFRVKKDSLPKYVKLQTEKLTQVNSYGEFEATDLSWYYDETDDYLWIKIETSEAVTLDISTVEDVVGVELQSFTAVEKDGRVLLKWQTSSETNNYGFEVMKRIRFSSGHTDWQTIAFIKGHGTSSGSNQYEFTDNQTQSNDKIEYQLKQIDFNGTKTYSDIVEISLDLPTLFKLYQNYPNPFNNETVINYTVPYASHVRIKIYNIIGNELNTLLDQNKSAGQYSVRWNSTDSQNNIIPNGLYFCLLESRDNQGKPIKKMIKMLLIQ